MMKAGETLQHSCPLLGHGQKSGRGEKISAREIIESGITNYLSNRAGRSSTFEANGLMPCATKSSDESSDTCVDVDQLHRLLESTSIDGDDCMKGSESCSNISQEKLQQHERKGKEHDNTQPVDATGCEKPLLPKHQLSPQSESTETVPTDEGPNFVQIITREVFEAVENLGSNTRTETLVTSITERQRVVVDLCSRQRRQEADSSWPVVGLPWVDYGKQRLAIPAAVWTEPTKKRPKFRPQKRAAVIHHASRLEGEVISQSRLLHWTVAKGPGLTADEQQRLNDVFDR
ncbi:hypothetical protein F5883DRAFT_563716 [Diaporthe sp. PMI_573]|nr:hypothetical protein F5883DRAFT_563716 [Diaporthaceae sp. PMI_573]